jgi:hypothetical protein
MKWEELRDQLIDAGPTKAYAETSIYFSPLLRQVKGGYQLLQ